MKKIKIVLCFMLAILLVTGCGKQEEPESENLVGGWNTDLKTKYETLSESEKKTFEKATKDYSLTVLEPVSVLAVQHVSGKNYMYLTRSTTDDKDPETGWKLVVIYVDKKGNATTKDMIDFDYTEYTNVDIEVPSEELDGGWVVNSKLTAAKLDETVAKAYEDATNKLVGTTYTPVAYLGSQLVSGNNYAVLALGKTSTKDAIYSINVLTVYEDLDGNNEIVSIANVDLNNLNNKVMAR